MVDDSSSSSEESEGENWVVDEIQMSHLEKLNG